MACCLLRTKPLSEPMEACGRLDLWKQFSVKFETIFLQYNEFEYVIYKMAAILSRPQCVFVFLFVFDGLYLYLYLIRFSPVYLYLYLKLWEKMYLYLYLIKRIWPQPWLLLHLCNTMAADTYDSLATRMDQGISSHYIDQCSRNITLSGMTGFQYVYTTSRWYTCYWCHGNTNGPGHQQALYWSTKNDIDFVLFQINFVHIRFWNYNGVEKSASYCLNLTAMNKMI